MCAHIHSSTSHTFFKEASQRSQCFGTSHKYAKIYTQYFFVSINVPKSTSDTYTYCIYYIISYIPLSVCNRRCNPFIWGSKVLLVKVHREITMWMYTLVEISNVRDTCATLCRMRRAEFPQGAWESITIFLRQWIGYQGMTTCQTATWLGCHHLIYT